ncbi:hypothetical protein H6G06_21350 [Anabaena sphaerica FACHB-251]|uniref:Uncharacterized protein n=1 Tax=Anabaena sphaerica FACHB-251 TaxID=2692883 RepID=A0A926WJW4_9NOST|nr:hypothetical protein [Anabaena sphaerica]MBD2295951.1 hypothetical protein [Anabaena sphaerica FACHB-251]
MQITKGVVQGAVAAASVELIFSILENSLLYLEGKITKDELIKKVASDTAQAGLAVGTNTVVLLTISMIYPPIAAVLSAVAILLTAAGVGFMSKRAWEIWLRWVNGGNVSSISVE